MSSKKSEPTPHIPVLLNEVLDSFEKTHLRTFVDGTLGAGGHATALLNAHPEIEQFLAIDQDAITLEATRTQLDCWKDKTTFIHGNFNEITHYLDDLKIEKVDGVLLDLGVSSMQLDHPERGFSFLENGPLDMRMNPDDPLSAEEIVNQWTERELGKIFREYGEEKRWRLAARTLVHAREEKQIQTTQELTELLTPVLRKPGKQKRHPLTLVFQALRIAVNDELEVIKTVIPNIIDRLNPNGRLAVITFHSLEDRIVKHAFRWAASDKQDTSGSAGLFLDKEPLINMVTRKPRRPTEEEVLHNPRSRSAKLRVVERK